MSVFFGMAASTARSVGGPSCDAKGWEIEVSLQDGAGALVALADIPEVEPTRVKESLATTWVCEFVYSAEVAGESPVYTVNASVADQDSVAENITRADLEANEAPFIYLQYKSLY